MKAPRRDSTAEALANLKPAFQMKGTITAGNSSQMSDGAAAAIVMSEDRAKELVRKPLARFVAYATAGCPPEEMGIGPVYRDSESAETRRADARRHRGHRTE